MEIAIKRILSLSLSAILLSAGIASSQDDSGAERVLVVGTKEAPPFSMKSKDGTWYGLSIELWRRIADALDLKYEFRELELKALVDGASNGSLDAVVAAMTITTEREKKFDFTHSFHSAGLGIAVASKTSNPWVAVLRGVASLAFLKVVGVLCLVLLAAGFLVWIFERKRNVGQFGGRRGVGIGSAFWWSAVTMTTVGYGDKAPITLGGRIVALIWMFTSILVISSITAAIASALTVTQLESAVQGPEDLPHVRVGSVEDTASADYLQKRGIFFRDFPDLKAGLKALADAEIDALVYDEPILRYQVKKDYPGNVVVLPKTFRRQEYGIALPADNPLREQVNQILLEQVNEPWWEETLTRLLGE